MAESSQTPRFLKMSCLSQGACFSLCQSYALPVCAAPSRVSQLAAVTPKGVGTRVVQEVADGMFQGYWDGF